MDSLKWVDQTYTEKHKSEDPSTLRPMYYSNLQLYSTHHGGDTTTTTTTRNKPRPRRPKDAAIAFIIRYGRKAALSLLIYLLSYLPIVGRFVLPAASFYTLNQTLGPLPALIIFSSGIFLPKRCLVVFLQSFFASRSLMRELVRPSPPPSLPLTQKSYLELTNPRQKLEPYFSRIKFTKSQKNRWFRDREGLLFGFGVGFYIFLKIPLLGVLIYGIAEASTAYLVTKITDPPPPPPGAGGSGGGGGREGKEGQVEEDFAESQTRWRNKHEFLKLGIGDLDFLNKERGGREGGEEGGGGGRGTAKFEGKKFS